MPMKMHAPKQLGHAPETLMIANLTNFAIIFMAGNRACGASCKR